MSEFIQKIGLDWRLLLSQAVNFLFLIIILRAFAYKPIIEILRKRREKIVEGLTKSDEADRRLGEVQEISKKKLKETEGKILGMYREAEQKGKAIEARLLEEAHIKEAALLKSAELAAKSKAEEAERRVREEAVKLVKDAIRKTVELEPEKIDEALIKKAVQLATKYE